MGKSLRGLWWSMAGAGVLGLAFGFPDGYVLILFSLIGAVADALPVPDQPTKQNRKA